MDPPGYGRISFRKKILLTALVFGLNCLFMGFLVVLAFLFLDRIEIKNTVNYYTWLRPTYFAYFSFGNLWMIFYDYSLTFAISEEIIYRYPVMFLTNRYRWLQSRPIVAAFLFIISNYIWTSTHIGVVWPIFISGLAWSWLTFKTKSIWPAIVCHTLANLFLYFMVQFLIHYKTI